MTAKLGAHAGQRLCTVAVLRKVDSALTGNI